MKVKILRFTRKDAKAFSIFIPFNDPHSNWDHVAIGFSIGRVGFAARVPYPGRKWWKHTKDLARKWGRRLQPWPQYYLHYSRDCDGMEVWDKDRFATGWQAHKWIMQSYEDAEGPVSWEKVDRKTYDEYETRWRDLYAERAGY